ncbi:MAG: hypothetical protein GY869_30740 [Planctomycetes bacterium]|nr:hypothetical protein [Planctomycetota bacterium]
MPQEIAEFRLSATQSNQHKRTPEIIAELALGMNLFLKFAQETGAIDGEEFGSLWHRCWQALGQAAAAQVTYQSANDPVQRFIELLSSAIASGRTHIAGDDGAAPSNPSAWGWRQKTMGYNSFTTAEWQPLGDRIGWVEGDDLYLIPDASYQAAQQMAGNGGEGITLALRTLQKRLKERGKLLTTEDGRLTCRKVLEGSRRRVLHLAKGSLVCKEVDQLGHLGHEPQPSDGNEDCGPVLGTTSGMITDESGPGTGPQTPILYS